VYNITMSNASVSSGQREGEISVLTDLTERCSVRLFRDLVVEMLTKAV
jgi:hypothetical protein